MNALTVNGLAGSLLVVLAICAIYMIVTKKASWSLPDIGSPTIPDNWKKICGNGLLALAAAAVFYWSLYTPGLRFSQVGSWSWGHWLWLLLLWSILVALVAVNAKALGTWAAALQSVMAAALFLLFIGVPAGIWIKDLFLPVIHCPDGSASVNRSCRVNTACSSWIQPEPGTPNGMWLCFNGAVKPDSMIANGRSLYRFCAYEGTASVTYRFKDYPCGGPL